MAQIKLRGLKLLEGGAQVAALHPYGENLPAAKDRLLFSFCFPKVQTAAVRPLFPVTSALRPSRVIPVQQYYFFTGPILETGTVLPTH